MLISKFDIFIICIYSCLHSSAYSYSFLPLHWNGKRTLPSKLQDTIARRNFAQRMASEVIEISEAVRESIDGRRDETLKSLGNVIDPDNGLDIVSSGFVKNLRISEEGNINFDLALPESYSISIDDFRTACKSELKKISWVNEINIAFALPKKSDAPVSTLNRPGGMSGVRNVIAVSSCKGGVGKSTVSVNLAYTLQQAGAKVGILDADIYGPSLPTMTKPPSTDVQIRNNQIYPLEYEGVKLMSMGFINRGASIMRGPMVNQVLNQFVSLTQWGDLDYLIVDMPPGTGDIQLTLAQIMNISAAVIVTTPQRLSFVDVVKGIDLFDTVNVPCVAVVENMAEYLTYSFPPEFYTSVGAKAASVAAAAMAISNDPSKAFEAVSKCVQTAIEGQCKGRRLFGGGHMQRLRDMWGMENLYSLPLIDQVATSGDSGIPYVLQYPDSEIAETMELLAEAVINEISRLARESGAAVALSYDASNNLMRYGKYSLSPPTLRRDCKCAVCVEEFTGRALLNPASIPESIKPLSLAPIGRYAMAVDWSDGHKALYPYKQILALVEQQSNP